MIIHSISSAFRVVARRTARAQCLSTAEGPQFELRQQPNDKPRKTCARCGFIVYQNPKVVCGSVLTLQDSRDGTELFVLGRRTIEPRSGFWGIPAGFMEMGETSEQGAAREAREELNADANIGKLLAVYSLPHIGQIQMIYSSVFHVQDPKRDGSIDSIDETTRPSVSSSASAGQETDKVSFVRWEDIPWDNLAFPTTSWALWHHRQRVQGTKSVSSVRPPVQSLFGNEHCTGVGRGSEEPTGHEGDFLSPETVFTAPGDDHTLFWCPHRGLHRKGDWKLSTDS